MIGELSVVIASSHKSRCNKIAFKNPNNFDQSKLAAHCRDSGPDLILQYIFESWNIKMFNNGVKIIRLYLVIIHEPRFMGQDTWRIALNAHST